MMYWPRPSELQFRLSEQAARAGYEIIEASILAVDRCWRGSVPGDYIPHTKTYHYESIDQTSRNLLLEEFDRLLIPEVRMLGNSHLAIMEGVHLFVLIREMADLGYIDTMPFAVPLWEAEKFQYYFKPKHADGWEDVPLEYSPLVEQPMLQLHGVE